MCQGADGDMGSMGGAAMDDYGPAPSGSGAADMMSIITMHKLMGLLMTGGEHGCARVVRAACMIGDAIEQEVVRIHKFLKKTKRQKVKETKQEGGESDGNDQEQEELRKVVNNLIKKQKLRAVRQLVKGQDDSKPWGTDATAKVGSRLIELLLLTAYIQPHKRKTP
ncbi:unnamed protein product [Fraxinus pennsylvanica]|uniref:DNA-directed RNA polymerase N-terminal domain-containing protein n=1 Tax=Fraxinus pennsylvanica TaxID=56036 RepID=A0AAD2AKF9_9LAMI|nr:unnamed protein product [Fraxinus pennsylvanica]